MINKILLFGFILITTFGCAPSKPSEYLVVDENSKTVPDSIINNEAIAHYITDVLKTDKEKARAIYIWIAHNIKYDLDHSYSNTSYESSQDFIDEVLTKRKGVCQHYSELFHAMSKSAGLNSYLIGGYTRNSFGEISDEGHAWNGIEIDSSYYLIDVTWAAGYKFKDEYIHEFRDDYFIISPKEFIKNHMPFDPIWQFLDNPINNNEFISKDFSKLDVQGTFAFNDYIKKRKEGNELAQLEKSNKRIIENGIINNLIKKEVDRNILQITNRKYNLAIDTFNFGVKYFNLFINHKNRYFLDPELNDTQVKELIDNADNGIYAANELLNELSSSNCELNSLIMDTRNRMPHLISDLEREKNFVDLYLKE
ncbi:transglutaminase domain-containing protein [Labilibacter marinus]|uniref:transglutaminase domain-containing protein n=1 Tax=Labilibacter marinus TaxID=1477105 RepID=UPI00094FDAF1|nr:transglutaminase domain-containing protein [Labilibacter marinus]